MQLRYKLAFVDKCRYISETVEDKHTDIMRDYRTSGAL